MEPDDLQSIPPAWEPHVGKAWDAARAGRLGAFLRSEYAAHPVYPPAAQVFTALWLTPPENVKVVILGQDPYHGEGQAHGLAFSVRPGVKPPPSLANIFKELKEDVGVSVPRGTGDLSAWARQGVLLLNTTLTVRSAEPLSHRGAGWEPFTDEILQAVSIGKDRVVFVLWGGHAQKKLPLIDASRHGVIQSAHPSPLSARNGFFGSRPFSKANALLREFGRPEVDWRLG